MSHPPMPRAHALRVAHDVQLWSARALFAVGMVLGATPLPAFADFRPLVPVSIASAVTADVPVYQSGIGMVQAFNMVKVHSRVDGQWQKIASVEGQELKAGDILAVIDPSLFQATLDQAIGKMQQDQALLANGEAILDSDQQLRARDFASQQTVDTQYSTVQQLKAQILQDNTAVTKAQTQLASTQITSPIDGRIGFRGVDLGALATLWVYGFNRSVIALIGVILLIGIVKKNGIMMVDFAIAGEREDGLTPEAAVRRTCLLRFRPIMMTTLAAPLGRVPLMVGHGTGWELRQPLGNAIVGGLIASQALTLDATPVIYLYLDRLHRWVSRRRPLAGSLLTAALAPDRARTAMWAASSSPWNAAT